MPAANNTSYFIVVKQTFSGGSGSYSGVMGLPLCRLVRLLGQLGLPPVNEITSGCHEHLDIPCPVYAAITRGEQAGPFKGEE